MRVTFHPGFSKDVRRFKSEYAQISSGLATRFGMEIDAALDAVKASPTSAGHLVGRRSDSVHALRRHNLRSFPFFILYGLTTELLIFGTVIPSRSDPLTWLIRFK